MAIVGNYFTNGISELASQCDGLVARSFLLATSSCHPELKLGPRPGPHPAHCPPARE